MIDDANKLCLQLDAYLDGDLPVDERAEFVAHLNHCPACSESINQQHWIYGLLQSDAAAEIESAPVISLQLRPRRHRFVAAAAVAAAALIALAAWPLMSGPRNGAPGEGPSSPPSASAPEAIADADRPSPDAPFVEPEPQPQPPVATFVSAGHAIALPVAGSNSEVTIVKLYPTFAASRRMPRTAAASIRTSTPNGG